MTADLALRPGEETTELPPASDASLIFIGRIRTPWSERSACPRRGDAAGGPPCTVELDPRWTDALDGVSPGAELDLIYWMHLARRDLVRQRPRQAAALFGTFALRSPMRPNPIAVSRVRLLALQGPTLTVRGLDCVDGTPLLDLKPSACPMWSEASSRR